MKHIQSFQQYNEGFLSKAAATAALGISALAPQKAHGQLGHKIKDFIKKEVSVTKSNLPKPGETKIIDNKELNNLSLDDYQSFGNLPLSRLPEGNYMITTTISQTKSAGEMQALQALKMNAENKKIVRVFNYNKELKNGNIQIVSIAQLK
jgi:hypothetical protein